MASNPKDPMSRFFEVDIAGGKRSNFNWSYKNRTSMDFGYLVPVALYDVPSDVHFELDLQAALSSNPTLAPLLGKVDFRVEAYFVEKAAYVDGLRNNEKIPLDRNVAFPVFPSVVRKGYFSPRTGILEMLQMYPAGWCSTAFSGKQGNFESPVPKLNAIPFIMYYDIFRNYYINPQDDNAPLRYNSFIPRDPSNADSTFTPIEDVYVTRDDLDNFIRDCRIPGQNQDVLGLFSSHIGVNPFGFVSTQVDNVYPSEYAHQRCRHRGLMRRTYNNDFFTSFVSNDNVELMKSRANVAVQTIGTGSAAQQVVNVEQISLANRNWRIATRSLLWGTDWKDYNKVHYGVNLVIPYGKPQFLGSLKSAVTFNDVISQAQTGEQGGSPTSNVNLGSRAAIAFGGLKNHNGHFVEFNTKDEGYVMVLASIVPEVDYYQGIDPMFFKTNLQHSWMVELNSVGMQDFHTAWMTAIPNTISNQSVNWEEWNVAEHKVPIWFEYMAKYNQLHGDFTSENLLRYWVFARPFSNLSQLFPGVFNSEDSQPELTPFTSTYVLPELFNYIFANNVGVDNFQAQFRFDCKVSSMLDKQVIAYL